MSIAARALNGLSARFQFALTLGLSSEPAIVRIAYRGFIHVECARDAQATVKFLCDAYYTDEYTRLREAFLQRVKVLGCTDSIVPLLLEAEQEMVTHAA